MTDYGKAGIAARVMPFHAPPGLDISAAVLNFAAKINGIPPEHIHTLTKAKMNPSKAKNALHQGITTTASSNIHPNIHPTDT